MLLPHAETGRGERLVLLKTEAACDPGLVDERVVFHVRQPVTEMVRHHRVDRHVADRVESLSRSGEPQQRLADDADGKIGERPIGVRSPNVHQVGVRERFLGLGFDEVITAALGLDGHARIVGNY